MRDLVLYVFDLFKLNGTDPIRLFDVVFLIKNGVNINAKGGIDLYPVVYAILQKQQVNQTYFFFKRNLISKIFSKLINSEQPCG